MPYVSARYAPPRPEGTMPEGGSPQVIATDENGVEWHLTEDSQVGDWLEYIRKGGTIEPYVPDPAAKPAEIPRDVYAELDALDARVTALENG